MTTLRSWLALSLIGLEVVCGSTINAATGDAATVSMAQFNNHTARLALGILRNTASFRELEIHQDALQRRVASLEAALEVVTGSLSNMVSALTSTEVVAVYPDVATRLADGMLALQNAWHDEMALRAQAHSNWVNLVSNSVEIVLSNQWHAPDFSTLPVHNRQFLTFSDPPASEMCVASEVKAGYQAILVIENTATYQLQFPPELDVYSETQLTLKPGHWIIALTGLSQRRLWVQAREIEGL